jgi:competence protein ComEA
MTGRPVSSNEQSVGETSEAKREEFMKKMLLALAMWFAISGVALAVVNINTATKEELTSLKGVGEKRAQEIINYRTKNGPFKTVDDLEKVPGIGPGIMKQIRSEVTTSGKTDIGKAAAKDAKATDATKAKTVETKKTDEKKAEKK